MAPRDQYRLKFKTCQHDWELHVDIESSGGKATGNSIFQCQKCGTYVTLLEKAALDSLLSQEKSQLIQEQITRISMWANVIAAGTLVIAGLALFFGDRVINYF